MKLLEAAGSAGAWLAGVSVLCDKPLWDTPHVQRGRCLRIPHHCHQQLRDRKNLRLFHSTNEERKEITGLKLDLSFQLGRCSIMLRVFLKSF